MSVPYSVKKWVLRRGFLARTRDWRAGDARDAQRFNCQNCARVAFDVADKPPL